MAAVASNSGYGQASTSRNRYSSTSGPGSHVPLTPSRVPLNTYAPTTPGGGSQNLTGVIPSFDPIALLKSAPIPGYKDLPSTYIPPIFGVKGAGSSLRKKLEDDLSELKEAVQRQKEAMKVRKLEWDNQKVGLDTDKKRMLDELDNLRKQAGDLVKALEKEREEVTESQKKIDDLDRQTREHTFELSRRMAEIEEWTEKVNARRQIIQRQKTDLERQAARNAPELKFLEDSLGLKIRGRGKDLIHFKFTNVDGTDYKRAFTFECDISNPSGYSVSNVHPPLISSEALPKLVEELNKTRDFYSFVKGVRKSFKDVVEQERKDRR